MQPEHVVLEGTLQLAADSFILAGNGTETPLAIGPRGSVLLMVVSCRVRVVLREGQLEHVESLDDCAYSKIGPIETFTGTIVAETAAPGTKLAGTTQLYFDAQDGTRYELLDPSAAVGPTTLRGRKLTANMAYAARTTESSLWIEP